MEKLDENSFEYWEKILEKEGLWDIDNEIWIKNNKKNLEKTLKTTPKKIDFVINPDEYIKNFEKENPWFKVKVDFENFEIEILDKNWLMVWYIWPWIVPLEWFETEEHLYFEVDEKYRWKNFWKFLYSIYKYFSKKDKNFVLPSYEFVNSPSALKFYLQNEIFSIVEIYDENEKNFRELDEQEVKKYLKEKWENFFDKDWKRIIFRLSN